MAKKKQTKEVVLAAIAKRKGKLFLAAGDLKITAQTLRNYSKEWPEVRLAIAEAKGKMLDLAESKLFKAIEKGQAWAICFYLKTQGKRRGYVERAEPRPSGDEKAPPKDPAHANVALTPEELSEIPLDLRRKWLERIRAQGASENAKAPNLAGGNGGVSGGYGGPGWDAAPEPSRNGATSEPDHPLPPPEN